MILHIIRAVFLLAVLALTISFATTTWMQSRPGGEALDKTIILVVVGPVVLGLGVMFTDMFWRRKNLRALSGLFFGVVAGLLLAYVLGLVVDLVAAIFPATDETYIQLVKVFIGATSVYLCASFIMQTRDDFRFIIPYVEFSKETKGSRPLLLDTSAIVDGRIADIAETRILDSPMCVPRFVLAELQNIADSSDKLRRNRGRRGLDVLNRLRASDFIEVQVLDTRVHEVDETPDVDAKLVVLAQHMGGRIITNDYNLNKICQLRGVDVININDLANALKPVVLPGETMKVKIIKPGEEIGQGVGYLDDGTMVVVEQGREFVGDEVSLTVTSVLQTSAGRMIFGRIEGASPVPPRSRTRR